ncbi:MAG TPA: DUF3160 domain-containing protein [Anaerolineaceae bacterium]|nr:DUF3160 domain-containing protein [Anaerolineaceae bacterium]HPN53454.1 DUF3160 domain-containing protein [Anaerolineaceae bacterium]
MQKSKLYVLTVVCCVMALVMSCTLPAATQATSAPTSAPVKPTAAPLNPTAAAEPTRPAETAPTSAPEVTRPPLPVLEAHDVYIGRFAEYQQQNVSLPTAFSGGYTLPVDLNQVTNMDQVNVSDAQRPYLSTNGFVVAAPTADPGKRFSEFYQGYESIRYDSTPVFITTDSIFHVYHLLFDKMLRDLEKNSFIPTLKELTSTMVTATTQQYQQVKGTSLEDAALRNVAFFTIAASLLQTGDAVLPEAKDYVDAELALINGAAGVNPSPLWANSAQPADLQLIEDYSQYIPRGHYTRSADLEMYFKAMMWYGRLTFRLKDPLETQRALLLTQALRTAASPSGQKALALWQNIYDPTVFIVGKADDLGVYEYGVISDKIFGENPQLTSFADPALFQNFIDAARQLPPPQINSMWVYIWQDRNEVTQGFRFMGQRFTLDEYVFGQVIWRNVGTLEKPRDLPKALDFFAAQGSELALRLLQEMGAPEYENYTKQMTKVTDEVSKLGLDSWTQNLYWSWLYALQPVFAKKGAEYPAFMQTDAWARKDLAAALSSWTELKHDTILYSKQVMAEMGGGGPDTPPHGYVEPNPEAYARLLALAQMTRTGLQSRGLLDEVTQGNLDNLTEELSFLLDISQKELSGGAISNDDYWRIQYYGGWLEAMTVAAADSDTTGGRNYLEDQKSPVVADIATGIGGVLEEGVGYPTLMYVVLPYQPLTIGVGVVYTYYEFTVSPDQRMTDEAWRAQLELSSPPAMPDWTQAYIRP